MRLLNFSLRNFLLYSFILVLVTIPISFVAIHTILEDEVDETLLAQHDQFVKHIRSFEYLDDLEFDLEVFEQLSYDVDIVQDSFPRSGIQYSTVFIYDSLDQETKPYRELRSSIIVKGHPYLLTTRLSLLENDDLVTAIVTVVVALLVLLTIGMILINSSLSQRIWQPFYKTLNRLKAYELDKNESFEFEQTEIIEFDDLNNAVRQLTDRNKQVFIQQKEFIENASHELQTPLAIFQVKLDALMQSRQLTEEQAGLVKDMLETNQRLSRLNKNLLLLSKIENDQFQEREQVDLKPILLKQLENFSLLTSNMAVHARHDISACTIYANRILTEVLITNLVGNAYQHTHDEGEVIVQLAADRLTVANTGKPLTIAPDRIFERFNKASKPGKGVGLGLAIVKQICDHAGHTVQYTYTDNRHYFTVYFNDQIKSSR
ncbi:sensor histidine kinase [Ohtaekwangia sp.]|uniref:sensor histidine kinase n=1 Tax=Ohtaekwangia sp. TaxID=2066019 RepID=UPI002FDCE869